MKQKGPTPEELEAAAALEEKEPFHILDIFNYETFFNAIDYQNPGMIDIAVFYVILLIPTYVIVRSALFLILPKSWLRWMFRI